MSEQLGTGHPSGNTIPHSLEVGGDLEVVGNLDVGGVVIELDGPAPTVTGEWEAGSPGVALCAALASLGLIVDSTTEGE